MIALRRVAHHERTMTYFWPALGSAFSDLGIVHPNFEDAASCKTDYHGKYPNREKREL